MAPAQREFLAWVSDYTLASAGSVLRLAMSVPAALAPPKPQTGYVKGTVVPSRMTPARARVLDEVDGAPPRTSVDLAKAAGVTPSVVKGLADLSALVPVQMFHDTGLGQPNPDKEGPELSKNSGRGGGAPHPRSRSEQIFRDVVGRGHRLR